MTIGKNVKAALSKEFVKSKSRIKLSQGEMLRIIREKNELTQSELAALSGLTQATISSLEANRISLGVERAKAIAKILKVHPAVLVFPDWTSAEVA
jgi:transcriptional regulator with XRE-family HTH domain